MCPNRWCDAWGGCAAEVTCSMGVLTYLCTTRSPAGRHSSPIECVLSHSSPIECVLSYSSPIECVLYRMSTDLYHTRAGGQFILMWSLCASALRRPGLSHDMWILMHAHVCVRVSLHAYIQICHKSKYVYVWHIYMCMCNIHAYKRMCARVCIHIHVYATSASMCMSVYNIHIHMHA